MKEMTREREREKKKEFTHPSTYTKVLENSLYIVSSSCCYCEVKNFTTKETLLGNFCTLESFLVYTYVFISKWIYSEF